MYGSLTSPRRAPRTAILPALALLLLGGQQVRANDDVVLIQFLAGTAADSDAHGKARWRDKGSEMDFNVELENMDAGSYDVMVGGVMRGSIAVDGTGEGEIEFVTPVDGSKPLFDFEVFGQQVVVAQGSQAFFDDIFDPTGDGSPPDGSDSSKSKIEVFMVNVGPDANAKGKLRYEQKPGKRRFKVTIESLDDGMYDLLVGGTVATSFDTTGLDEVELSFRDPPDDTPSDDPGEVHLQLDFDPRGQQIDVVAGMTSFLTGILPSSGSDAPPKAGKSAKDLGKKKGDRLEVQLFGLGLLPGARGKVTLDQTGETELEVELEDVADGSYSLCVGGVDRATITVSAGQGQVEFSDAPSGGQLLLDFDVKGELIEVKTGLDVFLSTIFPTSVPDALGAFKKEKSSDNAVRVNLLNAGADLDTRGSAQWKVNKKGRQRLKLQVLDLAAGIYTVRVAGVGQGTVTLVKNDGKAVAKFDSSAKQGSKSQLLDFDVLGQVLEIVDGEGQVQLTAIVQ